MLLLKKAGLIATGTLLLSTQLMAGNDHQQLIVPKCLGDKIEKNFTTIASNKSYRLIDIETDHVGDITLIADKSQCGRFINVSSDLKNHKNPESILAKYTVKPKKLVSQNYVISHSKTVNALLPKVSSSNIWQTLTHLTDYYNRAPNTASGVETAHWLKKQFDDMAKDSQRNDVNSYFVLTQGYKQPSVVTVIGKDIQAPAVVIGAHMDTLKKYWGMDAYMPGAGDDGSGTSSLMETARVLLSSKEPLKNPVYIIWYSAEEQGLVGSKNVVAHFLEKKIPVKAVMQFDMTGFRNDQNDSTMWVFTDYTDTSLSSFIAKLIQSYVGVKVDYSSCGYGCSDHASWTYAGFPAAFPCETDFPNHNPNIHSPKDLKETLSLEHMTNFSKLGVAFAVELAS